MSEGRCRVQRLRKCGNRRLDTMNADERVEFDETLAMTRLALTMMVLKSTKV